MIELIAGGLAGGIAGAWAATAWSLHRRYPETRWDWSSLDTSSQFPDDFLWGTATAAHQVEGGNTNNNWYRWEHSVDESGHPRIHEGQTSGEACQHWTRFPEDIARLAELGLKSYRFSLEWSRIEPSPGEWNEDAIAHYHQVLDCCAEHGITPMVTLHHFTHPLWFADLGSFEKRENVEHLIRFARRMFQEYGAKVPLWCTHNEPGPFSMMGWGLGVFPPGKKAPRLLGQVMANLMFSHVSLVAAYRESGHSGRIGLVKNIFQLDPWRRWSPLDWGLCRFAEEVYNNSILGFLKTNRFQIRVPGMSVDEHIPGDLGDFVGLNYYSHLLLSPFMKTEPPFEVLSRPGDIETDFPYCTYPEGFYRALMQIHEVGLPIYVTENGIPDAKDDRRADFITRYLYAMKRAMDDGADVRGFYYWSLLDNFEWAEGYTMRFGIFEVDFETQERRLREGARPLLEHL